MLAGVVACASEATSASQPAAEPLSPGEPFSPAESKVPSTDAETLRDGNTAFATDVYRTLRNDPSFAGKNLFFSPHSISTALAMTYAGARGTTEKEMAAAMHYGLPQDRLHPALNALALALASRGAGQKSTDEGEPFRLRTTSSVWAAPQIPFEASFVDTLSKNYGAGLRLTDFAQDPDVARGMINDWVRKETEDRIKDLLPAGSLTRGTRLVLTSAIYFNAAWQAPFPKSMTAKRAFHGAGGDVEVDMMGPVHAGSLPYAAGQGYQAVALPYAGGELSFIAVLPDDFASFESSFTAKQVASIVSSLAPNEVNVSLPKFRIDGASLSLKAVLRAQGMQQAFDEAAADFSGMTTAERLSISDVVHKAFVSVDEEGTEAAAATAVVSAVTGGSVSTPIEIDFDRPFVFFVRDNATGAILFLGRLQTL
jgi:serpin B